MERTAQGGFPTQADWLMHELGLTAPPPAPPMPPEPPDVATPAGAPSSSSMDAPLAEGDESTSIGTSSTTGEAEKVILTLNDDDSDSDY